MSEQTVEIFTWERARFIYSEAIKNGNCGDIAVFEWLIKSCKADYEDARIYATSPILKL